MTTEKLSTAARKSKHLAALFLHKNGSSIQVNRALKFFAHPMRFLYHNLAKRGAATGERQAITFFGESMHVSIQDDDGALLYFAGTLGLKEQAILNFFIRHVHPGDIFYDVGANYGFFTRLATHLGAQVHAFEPGQRILPYLRRNAYGATLNETAVGEKLGHLTFYDNAINKTGMSTAVKEAAEENRFPHNAINVPVTTLDSYRKDMTCPAFIKIDVEGFEAEVLLGAKQLLDQCSPTIIMEIATRPAVKTRSARALEILRVHGYQAHRLLDDGTLEPTMVNLDMIVQSDNFCFKKELPPSA